VTPSGTGNPTGPPPAAAVEGVPPTGEHLVHVGLVAGVPHDQVVGRVEDAVQGDGELDDAEVRPEVTTDLGDRRHDRLSELSGQLWQLGRRQRAQVGRLVDPLQHHVVPRFPPDIAHSLCDGGSEPPWPSGWDVAPPLQSPRSQSPRRPTHGQPITSRSSSLVLRGSA
jgi:hypothetical protein